MPPLQLRLPHMMVGVDEAGGHNLAMAIDHRGARRHLNILANLRDQFPCDEDVGVLEAGHMIIVVVVQDRSALKDND